MRNLEVGIQSSKLNKICLLLYGRSFVSVLETSDEVIPITQGQIAQTFGSMTKQEILPFIKTRIFPFRISSLNLSKFALSCGFGHIY